MVEGVLFSLGYLILRFFWVCSFTHLEPRGFSIKTGYARVVGLEFCPSRAQVGDGSRGQRPARFLGV